MLNLKDPNNFVYILRKASLYIPPFLKFVLTTDKSIGGSKENGFANLIGLMATTKVYEIRDKVFFQSEAQSYLEFAFDYQVKESLEASPEEE